MIFMQGIETLILWERLSFKQRKHVGVFKIVYKTNSKMYLQR